MCGMKKVIGALILAMLLSAVASAQPSHLQPGSALAFPLFDSAPGSGTVICVTNLNTNTEYCEASDVRQGDILVHYIYVDGETWVEFDRFEYLTPGDTLCVIADQHNPEGEAGFLLVAALDPTTQELAAFDELIGSAIVVQSNLNFLWSYTPYAFTAGDSSDPCDLDNPDVDSGDGDGALDFDGAEYDEFPEMLMVDSFFEETGNFDNQLTLMSTGGGVYRTDVALLFWNNVEEKFSRSFDFICWWSGRLSDISLIAKGLGGDKEELGAPPVETGWVSITPRRLIDGAGNPVGDAVPGILGVFGQFITSADFAAGHALHYTGNMDGLELLVGDGDHLP